MVGWIILGVIVAIFAVILLVPIGADVAFEGGQLRVSAKAAGVLIQLLPKKPVDETKPKKPKKEKKPKKPKKPKKEKPPKEKKKLSLNFTVEEIFALVKAVLRGLGRFGKLTVDRFLLHYTAAGWDPYNTAMTYNYVNAALSSLAPVCRKKFIVKDSDVWTDVDFTKDFMELDIGVCITLHLGQFVRMGFAVAFGALWILLKNKLRLGLEKLKNRGKTEQDPDAPAKADDAIGIDEIKEQNIQSEERKDENG